MEILTWGTCRVFFFNVLFIFPFIPSLQIVWSVFVYSSFPFITLQKVIFHFLASLLFPYTLKLRTCIETLLSFNINRSRNIVSAVKSYQSQNTFYSESLPTFSLQYILCLLHIILKFDLLSWQVPRSSVGRALYRESGPSQDGDPDTGNLPFSFFFRFFLMFYLTSLLYQAYKQCEVFLHTNLSLHCTTEGCPPFTGKFTLFLCY